MMNSIGWAVIIIITIKMGAIIYYVMTSEIDDYKAALEICHEKGGKITVGRDNFCIINGNSYRVVLAEDEYLLARGLP
jgi:hypothetical protein